MWKLALNDDLVMTENDITAGENESIFATAIQTGIPHAWTDCRPLHCPACLNAHAYVLLVSRGGMSENAAIEMVRNMNRGDLLACLDVSAAEPELAPDEPTG